MKRNHTNAVFDTRCICCSFYKSGTFLHNFIFINKGFRSSNNLREHVISTHSDEKTFGCPVCPNKVKMKYLNYLFLNWNWVLFLHLFSGLKTVRAVDIIWSINTTHPKGPRWDEGMSNEEDSSSSASENEELQWEDCRVVTVKEDGRGTR